MDTASSPSPSAPIGEVSSRRSFFTLDWRGTSPPPPTPASPPVIKHEEEAYEFRLINGRLCSFVEWPDFRLVDSNGQMVNLHRDILSGRAVVLSFFYTKCKGSCPVTTGRMIELHQTLLSQNRAARFVSITLEPEIDTPARLDEYKSDVLPEGADWHLFTGQIETLTALRRYLGFYDLDPEVDADPRRHAAMILMGNDATHRWFTLPSIASSRQWRSTFQRCLA